MNKYKLVNDLPNSFEILKIVFAHEGNPQVALKGEGGILIK